MADLTPQAQRVQDAQTAVVTAQSAIDTARQARQTLMQQERTARDGLQAAQKELDDALTALAASQGVQAPPAQDSQA